MNLHTVRSMTWHQFTRLALVLLCGLSAHVTRSNIIYDESVSGDLSNSGLAPTQLTLSPGLNDVLGATGLGTTGIDRDYFTFSVPSGWALTSIVVLPNTVTGESVGFIGIQAGPQVTVPPGATLANGLLGWKHFTADNGNIITDLGIPAAGSTGFVPPLGSGSYAFWIQEFSRGAFPYGFEFNLEPATSVPDSGPGLLLSAAAFASLLLLSSAIRGKDPLPSH